MKKIFTRHTGIVLILLFIALNALSAGIKVSVDKIDDAALAPVGLFAVTIGYLLGCTGMSARRAWVILILSGLLVILIETARLDEIIAEIINYIPRFDLELIQSLLKREPPDTSFLQAQFVEIAARTSAFFKYLLSGNPANPIVRETIWEIPILLLGAWAGWQTGRRDDVITALLPTLALHGFILNYTGRDAFSLQVSIFAFIALLGIHPKRGLVRQKNRETNAAQSEILLTVLLLSFALGFAAGWTPVISVREIARQIKENDNLDKMLGLEAKPVKTSWNFPSGLPREHLIDLSPSLSQAVVFTVKTGELPSSDTGVVRESVPHHYWRWLTYDLYNGQGWTSSPTENIPYKTNQAILPMTGERYKIIHQQVEKASAQDNRLYWTGSLARVSQSININWRVSPASLPSGANPILSVDLLGALTKSQKYEADSLVPVVSANQLRDSSQIYPEEIRARYLTLPESVPQRVLDLASKLTADATNPYDKAKAIETYLRTYPYSLDVSAPPAGRDVADYFLFDLKTGYCDYYATSMVVLARAVGLPSRLVIGYSSGIYNPLTAEYVVRELNAHSWVEVYFSGIGWVEFEPTANQPVITLPEKLPQEVGTSIASPTTSRLEVNAEARLGYSIRQDLYLLAVLLVFVIALAGLWFLRAQGLLRAHETIGSIYLYVYRHGKRIYRNAPRHETPSVFASNLQEKIDITHRWLVSAPDEINLLTRLYLQEIYSPRPVSKDERAHAVKVWRKLFWRLFYARVILAFRGLSPRKNPDHSRTSSHAD
jgi:transglutaminase-like putative cysteine protease